MWRGFFFAHLIRQNCSRLKWLLIACNEKISTLCPLCTASIYNALQLYWDIYFYSKHLKCHFSAIITDGDASFDRLVRLGSHHRVSNQVALAIWNFSQMIHITLAHAKCCRFARLLTLIIRWNDAHMKPLSLGYHLTLWAETFNYFTRFVSTTTKSSTYITIFSKWSFSLYLCIYLSVCLVNRLSILQFMCNVCTIYLEKKSSFLSIPSVNYFLGVVECDFIAYILLCKWWRITDPKALSEMCD